MAAAALLAVTLVPVLVGYWVRGRIRPATETPVGRVLGGVYWPVLGFVLKRRRWVMAGAVVGLGVTVVPLSRLGSEFMPPLWEGDLLYMPTTLPGVSITEAREILQQTDRIIYTFPEVRHVFGKVGRADSATDPAPLSMLETTIALKPRSEWRSGMTPERLIEELDAALRIPGLTNAWTMPIRSRIDMLSTGIRTPVGIKIAGPDLAVLERLGREVEAVVRDVPGTASVYADRVMGGNYLDFAIDRDAIARHGLTVRDVQEVIQTAIGGMNVTTTVEGLERYPVNLRYSRELRDDLPALRSVLVARRRRGTRCRSGAWRAWSTWSARRASRARGRSRTRGCTSTFATSDIGSYVEACDGRRWRRGSISRPGTRSRGAASTSTWSARSSGCCTSSPSPCS